MFGESAYSLVQSTMAVEDKEFLLQPGRGSCSGSLESGGVGLVQERRASSATTACLFLTALLVMSCGIITGVCLYHQFARAQKFNQKGVEANSLLKEEFEIEDSYEKISVPYFGGAKRSRFIHDFKTNLTGIVAVEDQRCFVMPLNRTLVAPPSDLIDLIEKLRQRYYDVDTTYLRQTMRVVVPAINNDKSKLGSYIYDECKKYPIYKLEKIVSGVYKRSVVKEYKFIEFAGKNTHELNIVNLAELEEHEAQRPIAMA